MSGRSQYLLALYVAQHHQPGAVSPSVVAEKLDRTPATVIEGFHQLSDEGLVTYEPYVGVELTDSGRQVAAELHETYVTLSWFFRSVLELDDYEAEAMEMAGIVSPEIARRLATTLPYDDCSSVDTPDSPVWSDNELK